MTKLKFLIAAIALASSSAFAHDHGHGHGEWRAGVHVYGGPPVYMYRADNYCYNCGRVVEVDYRPRGTRVVVAMRNGGYREVWYGGRIDFYPGQPVRVYGRYIEAR